MNKTNIAVIILIIGITVLSIFSLFQNEKINSLEAEVHKYMETNDELWDNQITINGKNLEMWELQIKLNEQFIKWG